MKIFKALSSVGDQPLDGFILDDGNKVIYLSREGVASKDFVDNRGEQVFPPLKAVEPVDPRAVRWGHRMVELVQGELANSGWHGVHDESPLADALRAVCEREYVPQPESDLLPVALKSYESLGDVPKDMKVQDAGGHVWEWYTDTWLGPAWLWSLPKGVSRRDNDKVEVGPFIEFTGEVQ